MGGIFLIAFGKKYAIADWLFALALLANLLGFYWGVTQFYGAQLAIAPVALWPFVPDCPIAALLLFLAMGLVWVGRKNDVVSTLAITVAITYGLWTMGVLTAYSGYYNTYNGWALSAVLWLAHLAMVVEALLLARETRFTYLGLTLAIAYLLANYGSDYLLGTAPPIPPNAAKDVATGTALLIAGVILAVFALKETKLLDDRLSLKSG